MVRKQDRSSQCQYIKSFSWHFFLGQFWCFFATLNTHKNYQSTKWEQICDQRVNIIGNRHLTCLDQKILFWQPFWIFILKLLCLAIFVCYKFVHVLFDDINNMSRFFIVETKSWVCNKPNLLHKFTKTPTFIQILFQLGKIVILTVKVEPRFALPCKDKLSPLNTGLLSFYHFVDKAEFLYRFQNSVDLKTYTFC